jgi:hypothetical protein
MPAGLGGGSERQPAVGDVRLDALAQRLIDADSPGRAGVSCSPVMNPSRSRR